MTITEFQEKQKKRDHAIDLAIAEKKKEIEILEFQIRK